MTYAPTDVVQKFDDLPAQYQANIDSQVPLDGRATASQPPTSEQGLDDLEAFLEQRGRVGRLHERGPIT